MTLEAYRFYGASNQSAARTVVDKPSSSTAVAKPPLPAITEPASAQASGSAIITKCVENGRISYGNQACAVNATATQLRTRANQNLLDSWKPAKATPKYIRRVQINRVANQKLERLGNTAAKRADARLNSRRQKEVARPATSDQVRVRPATLALNTLHHCYCYWYRYRYGSSYKS